MSFDYHGSWDAITAFNSPFSFDPAEPPVGGGAIQWTWNTAGSVAYFLANGVPANRLVVGIPFYGKEYTGVGWPATASTSRTERCRRMTRRRTTISSTPGSPMRT
jgi:Chitinase